MSDQPKKIVEIAIANGVKSYMSDLKANTFDEFKSGAKKISTQSSGKDIVFVLFGTSNKNALYFGVVGSDDSSSLLNEMQSQLQIVDKDTPHILAEGERWSACEVQYPKGSEFSALKMKDTLRGLTSQILKKHQLVTEEESDEDEQFGFDDL